MKSHYIVIKKIYES